MSVGQEEVETECESSDHDDKDDADCAKGEDDVLKEDDVFSDSVQEPHVEEEVDPGKGDGDGTDLPVQARAIGQKEVVGSDEESKGVNESIEEENSRQVWLLQLACLQLTPDWPVFLVPKEEYDSCGIQRQKDDSEVFVEVGKPIPFSSNLVVVIGTFVEVSATAVELFRPIDWRVTRQDEQVEREKEDEVEEELEEVKPPSVEVPFLQGDRQAEWVLQ